MANHADRWDLSFRTLVFYRQKNCPDAAAFPVPANLELYNAACYHPASDAQVITAGKRTCAAMKHPFLFFAALNGFLVVALGAFGAHALENRINVVMLDVYDTAVQYQMFHTLAFLALHMLARESSASISPVAVARLFIAGIVLFSGSLYLLAITSMTWLGMITPIGGILLLAGWFQLARASYGRKDA